MKTPSFIRCHVPLAPLTTLGVGGEARWYSTPGTRAALLASLDWAHENGIRVRIRGSGSNVLIADEGLSELVIHPQMTTQTVRRDAGEVVVTAQAGVVWDDLVAQAVDERWAGIECLAGIPGLVGAAPIQNIGAYGQEVCQVTESVTVWEPGPRTVRELSAEACGFAYRSSVFKRSPAAGRVVLALTVRLTIGGAPTIRYKELAETIGDTQDLRKVRDAVVGLRRGKSMVVDPQDPDSRSAGSFFMNPIIDSVRLAAIKARAEENGIDTTQMPQWPAGQGRSKLAAAWLIERAGLHKGFALGRAGLSSRHTLAVINRGGASAGEIVSLAAHIRATVHDAFGVSLVPEPVFLGFGLPTDALLTAAGRKR